jgi:Ferritin-like
MKTVERHVDDGFHTVADILQALELAMQLEFATIPPYLCAQWSIREDPDRVEGVQHNIAVQEMQHLALLGNIITALGGLPKIANPQFIPSYPMHELPGGIRQRRPIALRHLSKKQLEVFMEIERPESWSHNLLTEKKPATIGDFYNAILAGVKVLQPSIRLGANRVPVPHFASITNVQDVINTLERIKEEGEGFQDDPEEPPGDVDRATLAHYYAFKEIYMGRRLVREDKNWKYHGDAIRLPKVYEFSLETNDLHSNKFSQILSTLLLRMESCWVNGTPFDVSSMFELYLCGKSLIKMGLCPLFVWSPPEMPVA